MRQDAHVLMNAWRAFADTASRPGQSANPVPAMRKAIPKHPLAELGGRSMPEFGHIGGAKAVGSADKQFDRRLETALTAKRKREEQVRLCKASPSNLLPQSSLLQSDLVAWQPIMGLLLKACGPSMAFHSGALI